MTLKQHLSNNVTTLAYCWHVILQDKRVLGFTSFDQNIIYEEIVYKSKSTLMYSNFVSMEGVSSTVQDIEAILDDEVIKEDDIKNGLYDHAEVEIFIVNYTNLQQGKMVLKKGYLGKIEYKQGNFHADILNSSHKLSKTYGELFSRTCRAQFGDSFCKMNLENFRQKGLVGKAIDHTSWYDDSLHGDLRDLIHGKAKFITGANKGLEREVIDVSGNKITLLIALPNLISMGDEYIVEVGCDKTFETCVKRFNNAINFRGEPHLPGIDKILKTAGTFR